ncbi:Asp23/Gls24 family envelope stress response protein [Sutcliffiella deserti]|uniref:Asp23/Gls24 family envelope stress response protein n=1 Tax=Sutcliffiella deserti TaxID=2875501 RepID=UPI001CBE1D2A|nr:Asp23/Gls24 family envelope stress response protein [Sutcliffiella deserti]
MKINSDSVGMSNILIQTIISICVSEINDIEQIPPRLFGKVSLSIVHKEDKMAKIQFIKENVVSLEVLVAVKYNTSIPENCKILQKLIKDEIELITGYTVHSVNISVIGFI